DKKAPLSVRGFFIPPALWKLSFRCVLPFLFLLCFLWGQLWDGFRCLKYITAAGLDGNIGIFLLKCRKRQRSTVLTLIYW
ncbi:hypothetical protein ABC439_34105, partial [Pseudomonas aeruginosa]|uniref:hypothetical protein n=1 Tax=Pseudomonas aeruginosa TaxID=287 RepID=UPI0031F69B85